MKQSKILMKIADSGERQKFKTGAHRDKSVGKGRMDLLPMRALIHLSKHFEEGAIKYNLRNWEMGIPLSSFADSGMRHFAKFMIGMNNEPHFVAVCWNFMCMLDTALRIKDGSLPKELNDLPNFNIETMI